MANLASASFHGSSKAAHRSEIIFIQIGCSVAYGGGGPIDVYTQILAKHSDVCVRTQMPQHGKQTYKHTGDPFFFPIA